MLFGSSARKYVFIAMHLIYGIKSKEQKRVKRTLEAEKDWIEREVTSLNKSENKSIFIADATLSCNI